MSGLGLHPSYLRAAGCVERALKISCPICHEKEGQACRVEDGKPMVHDVRESRAFHGKEGSRE
jgi:hypothetical protein